MSSTSTLKLESQVLAQARITVFVDRRATLDELGSEYSLAELKETILLAWEDIRQLIQTLPDAAFERQADDIDGNDVWSAGQVISHLCDVDVRTQQFWKELFQVEMPPIPPKLVTYAGVNPLTRAQSIEALTFLDSSVAVLIDRVDSANDLDRTATHEAFGTAALKGALLITCIHLDDHVGQLREMQALEGKQT